MLEHMKSGGDIVKMESFCLFFFPHTTLQFWFQYKFVLAFWLTAIEAPKLYSVDKISNYSCKYR